MKLVLQSLKDQVSFKVCSAHQDTGRFMHACRWMEEQPGLHCEKGKVHVYAQLHLRMNTTQLLIHQNPFNSFKRVERNSSATVHQAGWNLTFEMPGKVSNHVKSLVPAEGNHNCTNILTPHRSRI